MKYEITEEQIKELAKGNAKVKKWYPEVFEIDFLNKWQTPLNKYEGIALLFRTNNDVFNAGYGFDYEGKWVYNRYSISSNPYNFRLATETEVLEALTNEAVKRGFKKGVYVNRDMFRINNGTVKITSNDYFDLFGVNKENLQLGGNCIFEKGKWAEIIKAYTKEEAEKMLNAKIV